MKLVNELTIVKQQAWGTPGQNFYILENGQIKRDYDLLKSDYVYKVINENGVIKVTDSKGKKIESVKIPSKLRNTPNAKAGKNAESEGSQVSAD